MIEASSKFRAPALAYVPKQIVLMPAVVATPQGERASGMMYAAYRKPSLEAEDFAHIDGTVAILQRAGLLSVVDASNAMTFTRPPDRNALLESDGHMSVYAGDGVKSYDMYGHVITVQKKVSGDAASDWHDDEDGPDDDNYYKGFTGIRTTPGWRVEIARREFVRVDEILDETSINDPVAHDELLVKFTYRWTPTASGEGFVPGTEANAALPVYIRQSSALGGGALREQEVHAHLVLKKTDKGWKPARLAAGWKDFGGPNARL